MKRWWAFWVLILLVPMIGNAQRRDTVRIQGHRFLFAETTDEDDGEDVHVVNLVRIDPLASKWLLKHTLRAAYPDCNSIDLELGDFVFTDSTVTFYTAWMYTGNAMAGKCGYRKQVYHVNALGRVRPGESLICMEVGPQHPCLDDLDIDAIFQEPVPKAAMGDRRRFEQCILEEYGARSVSGSAKMALIQEVKAALGEKIKVELKKESPDLEFIRCE